MLSTGNRKAEDKTSVNDSRLSSRGKGIAKIREQQRFIEREEPVNIKRRRDASHQEGFVPITDKN